MSIDSVDVRTLTTALLSAPKRKRIQAGLPSPAFFSALDAAHTLPARKAEILN
jgi:hypothetical protein